VNDIALYFRYTKISIKGQLEYRTSFVLQAAGQAILTATEFLGIWAMFSRFGQLRGWTLPEIAMFYGAINVAFSIADALSRGFDQFGNMVKSGDFDRLLLRPRSTVLQLIGQEVTIRKVGRLLQGIIVLAWAISAMHVGLSTGTAGLLLIAILSGVCLFTGLVILQATSAFWATESLEVWNAFTYGGVLMSQYPISIYRSWFRRFFTYVIPLACVTYYPILAVLNRMDPLGSVGWIQWVAPMAGILFLLIALQVWKIGVQHYRSTGS